MSVFYDPHRVRVLRHRTEQAIDASRRITSEDPAAAHALRTVASMRRTLEDHWMPALLDIERSVALTTWATSTWGRVVRAPRPLAPPDRPHGPPTRWSALGWDDFVEVLDRAGAHLDSSSPPTDAELDELAAELSRRLTLDPDGLDAIAARAGELPVIGELVARSALDAHALVAVLAAMTRPHGLVADGELDRHRETFELVVSRLLDDPADALAALSDREVLAGIAAWHRLDADLVESLTRLGLYDAVANDPARLADGYAVLAHLVELTNGPLDHGMHPAMALGVGASMIGYVDTLAPALLHEGSHDVIVTDVADRHGRTRDVRLGSWNDLVDLVGALLRAPAAQAALGTVIGGYTTDTIDRLGADVVSPTGVEPVARFADLVAEAHRSEQAELLMEAAAEEAERRRLAGSIGFAASAVMSATGVGAITRSIASWSIRAAAGRLVPVDAERLDDARLGPLTYDLIVLGALDLVAGDAQVRRKAGLASVPAAQWQELRARRARVDADGDPSGRARETTRLRRWIATEIPTLDRFLGHVRGANGMEELTQARPAVAAD